MRSMMPLLISAGLLAGCGTFPGSPVPLAASPKTMNPQDTGSAHAAEGNGASTVACTTCWIRVTPLSSLATDFTRYPDGEYSNGYTRLLISSRYTRDGAGDGRRPPAVPTELYKYNSRDPLARFLWGTHYTMNLTASVTVGAFQATVPLMTIDHISNRTDGEKFARIVTHTAQNFPLFLLKGDGSNSVASVRFVVKSTDSVDSNVAARAIQAADILVKSVAPASAVLTTLSAQQTKDSALALDKAIDQVLSKQLDEEQWIDNDIRRWKNGMSLTFRIPAASTEAAWDAEDDSLKPVGVWTISFEDPRPSIFSDVQVCPPWDRPGELMKPVTDANASRAAHQCPKSLAAAAALAERAALSRPEQVLGFQLMGGAQSLGTVAAYLKQTDFWADAMSTLVPQPAAAPNPDQVTRTCRNIKNAIAGIGLNDVDSGIVVAAVRDGMGLPAATIAAMKASPACALAVPLG